MFSYFCVCIGSPVKGDFVVQINGIPLISNQNPLSKSDDDVRLYHERVLDTIAISRRPRTLLVLRPSGPAADAFKLTMSLTMFCVSLSADQEKGYCPHTHCPHNLF